jgi:DNA-binding NarL/FixJ family response regulator
MFEERNEPIHLLVTDVVLPMIAGPELVQRVRGPHPDLRVLYVSGYTERALSLHLGEGGPATGFLQKPFTPGTFVRKVREVLDADLIPST